MRLTVLFIVILMGLLSCQKEYSPTIDLSGEWQFQLDSADVGIKNQWYTTDFDDNVTLPGSMATNNKGYEVSVDTKWTGGIVDSSWYKDEKYAKYRDTGNVKIPFWLQPIKYYAGAAWYKKTIIIPKEWKEKDILLKLERCHWETHVWIDGHDAGSQNSLATAHMYDLTNYLEPGEHTLTILVDNRVKEIDPGINAHSIADHTQSNWNGIVGKIELQARPKIRVDDIRIFTDVFHGKVTVKANVKNNTKKENKGSLRISTVLNSPGADPTKIQIDEKIDIVRENNQIDYDFSLGDELGIWDEFYPNIYTMIVELETSSGVYEKQINFGMRDFSVEGTRFSINGRPVFLRGTLECAIFPKTGYPPTDPDEWKRIFRVCKAHGLNHMRFHSWCPPEAAFVAADELGVYLQVECSSWANQSTSLGDGLPIDQYIYDESERIVKMYGNHPSFVMMAYGNEPRGANQVEFLGEFVSYWKEKDNRRVYTGGAGWPVLAENNYHNLPRPRIQGWGQGLNSLINAKPPTTAYDWTEQIASFDIPVVSHEIGQWCVYPNLNEIKKYDGVLKAKNFEIFKETLQESGMAHLADSFLLASGKLQALCYKADIEAALRTPGFAGFQLLDLHDFPGQGTALVGVLDPFWEEKGYITPEAYSRFCNATVPLARMEQRIFYNNETLVAQIEVAHFGAEELTQVVPEWSITDQKDEILYRGTFDTLHISIANNIPIGNLEITLKDITEPKQLTLSVRVEDFENSWDFWVYPRNPAPIDGVWLTQRLDQQAINRLNGGESVLWSIPESTKSSNLDDAIGFSSIFWNTAWTKGQKPHSLGILCDPDHPALSAFPSEYHSNWQWWDAMSYSNAILLSDFPNGIQPIVRVIDDWFKNRPQALIFEVRVGKGKLIISGVDFFQNMENRPEAKQLLYSLKRYIQSDAFNPKVEVGLDQLNELL